VTAVLIGNADHDAGVERAAPHLHFPSAHHLRARLRDLAQGRCAATRA
jgi:phosphoglycolate phosphatase